MNILDAYDQINRWIAASSGSPIDVGLEDWESCFSRLRSFNEDDLLDFESNNGVKLPGQYRSFLKDVGSADLFGGVVVLSPAEIKRFSRSVFQNFGEDPFPSLFLAVSMPRFGYFGGFLLERAGVENFAVFYPEVPPELWIDEADFVQFDQWIIRLVESKARSIS